MKKGAAQRACALLAALALCAALGTGVFAEAAPGPAESPAASGVAVSYTHLTLPTT